jgi:hypothetical protein
MLAYFSAALFTTCRRGLAELRLAAFLESLELLFSLGRRSHVSAD